MVDLQYWVSYALIGAAAGIVAWALWDMASQLLSWVKERIRARLYSEIDGVEYHFDWVDSANTLQELYMQKALEGYTLDQVLADPAAEGRDSGLWVVMSRPLKVVHHTVAAPSREKGEAAE